MDDEQRIHRFFNRLLACLNVSADPGFLHDWYPFYLGPEYGTPKRWNQLRDWRTSDNQQAIDFLAQELDGIERDFWEIEKYFYRAQADLERIEFNGESHYVVKTMFRVIRTVVEWHHADKGYWAYLPIETHSDRLIMSEQLKMSDAKYPLTSTLADELREALEVARSMMLRFCPMADVAPPVDLGNLSGERDEDTLSPDGLTLRWGGVLYPLSPASARVVRLLLDAFKSGFPFLHEEFLKTEAEFETDMRHVVRNAGLEKLIVRAVGQNGKWIKGQWGLVDPKVVSAHQ